jgi:hypothetical protein
MLAKKTKRKTNTAGKKKQKKQGSTEPETYSSFSSRFSIRLLDNDTREAAATCKKCPTYHRHPCQRDWTPPWTPLFAPQSIAPPCFLFPAVKINPPARVRLQAEGQLTTCQACNAHKPRAQQLREEGAKWPLSRFSKDWCRKCAPKKKRRKAETNDPVHMRPIRSPSPDCRVSLSLLSAATTATTLPIKPTHFILLPKTKKFQKVKILLWQ